MATLRASNLPLVNGRERSYLTLSPSAGDSTITILDYTYFAVSQYILIGEFGNERSEVIQIHSSTAPTSAGVVTLASNLIFPHSIDDPVTQIDYNQVEFSRAATVTGSKSVLTTANLTADDQYTSYNDLTNTTGYGFVRYKNSSSGAFSAYSGAIPYAGLPRNAVRSLKNQGMQLVKENISQLITEDFLLDELNNWQDDVTRQKDWDFEMDSATDTVVSGQKAYALPTAPYNFKYLDTDKAFIQIRIANYPALDYIDKSQYDQGMVGTVGTTLNGAVTIGATSIVLTSVANFPTAGSMLAGDGTNETITWTGVTVSTNTLTGVTGVLNNHASGATVWLTSSLGQPRAYTVYNDQYYFYRPASADQNGKQIYIDYFKQLAQLTSDTDTTPIPFFHIAQYYLAFKIEARKGNDKTSEKWRAIYEGRLASEMKKNRTQQYYSFKRWRTRA